MSGEKIEFLIAEGRKAAAQEREDSFWARTQQIRDAHNEKAELLESLISTVESLSESTFGAEDTAAAAASLTEYAEAFKNNPSSEFWAKEDVVQDILEWRNYHYGSPVS